MKKWYYKYMSHNFARIRIDSYSSFPLGKILTFHNVIILIKAIINENKNHHYYTIFLEKGLYKEKSQQNIYINECF